MSRNGSGGYSLPANSWNPAVNGVSATAADWQSLINDVAIAIQQSVSADGQTPITGNLAMGGNKLTGLGAGVGTGQSLRFEQLFSQGLQQDLASAATIDIGVQLTTLINVTGTITITSFGTNYNGPRFLRFAGALTLTNSATLVLPGGSNIITAAGDTLIAFPLGNPATGWQVYAYQRANDSNIDYLNTTRIDVASATTTDLTANAPNTRNINITGTTTITGFTVAIGQLYFVRFNAALTLTNNAAIITQTGADITTGAGDTCILRATAANTVEVLSYSRSVDAQIQPISASVAASALTISASGLSLDFRSATLGSGAVTTVSGTPSNLVISSGSTLGTTSAVQSRIAVLALNNAGTIELAAINIAGGVDLSETGLISTTAEGGAGAADSASVVYSTTARSNVAYRVIGYIESTQATAGTWATAPSTIQGQGGQALAAMSSFGYGQTWQDVIGSRTSGTTYYNTTGKPITVSVTTGGAGTHTLVIGGVTVATLTGQQQISGVVPPGGNYVATVTTPQSWAELR